MTLTVRNKTYRFGVILLNKTCLNIFLAVLFLVVWYIQPISAKVLNNSDLEKIRAKQNKGMPNKGSSIPSIPSPQTEDKGKRAVVVKKYLPYGEWEDEYRDYFKSHYNTASLKLQPKLIVLHYSGTSDFATLWRTYIKGGMYNYGGGKRIGHLSTHFVVDKDGSIYQLMPLDRKARDSYGVNHVAISVEFIGKNEEELLANKKQMRTSFALVRWLMRNMKIPANRILAHSEVALGKEVVPEYTDHADKTSPNRYPPGSNPRGPGKKYMYKLRDYLIEPR